MQVARSWWAVTVFALLSACAAESEREPALRLERSAPGDGSKPGLRTASDVPPPLPTSDPPGTGGPGRCGDGLCNVPLENCRSCWEDCGDCGSCEHDICREGFPLAPFCTVCVAAVCDLDEYCCSTAWDAICVREVSLACGYRCGTLCGDLVCGPGETEKSCPSDCPYVPFCGNGVCDPAESVLNCSSDCAP